jgi:predicted transcriptional regulator
MGVTEHLGKGDSVVPHEVASLVFESGMTPVRAWRTHLQLTQQVVAERMSVTQSAYSQLEASTVLRKALREKVAAALGIQGSQLDL